MKVFKFGGASVNSAESVKNAIDIIKMFIADNPLIVVSAMGKTTNAFEELLFANYNHTSQISEKFDAIANFHKQIIQELFSDKSHKVYKDFFSLLDEIKKTLITAENTNFDYEYARLVSYGEIISTTIFAHYLNFQGIKTLWKDTRTFIKTDSNFRDASVDWEITEKYTKQELPTNDEFLYVVQGFIGSNQENETTTLGREGSDYTAAILAYILDAEEVVVWKDVPGLLNADPKCFDDTKKIDVIDYSEAIELAFYGASIIHPKTIKPLQNKDIPLQIRSFLNPLENGSIVKNIKDFKTDIPYYIYKPAQVLLSLSVKDFSFIAEEHLHQIFGCFAQNHIKINLMQNSAISFSVCIDYDALRLECIKEILKKDFKVKYNENVELITLRYYNPDIIEKVLKGKTILLEQRSRITLQMVVRKI